MLKQPAQDNAASRAHLLHQHAVAVTVWWRSVLGTTPWALVGSIECGEEDALGSQSAIGAPRDDLIMIQGYVVFNG